MSGSWDLPRSTTRRIIAGETLPIDPQQAIAFLKACYVIEPADLAPWLAAAVRALDGSAFVKDISKWVTAHKKVLAQVKASGEHRQPLRLPVPIVARQNTVVTWHMKGRAA
ncbi:hypothetical protein [Streptomyces asoensis]|uniref:hypothetical protein n=1 Tax=Streptomyces asoensis TaxID=249586 RepID=UPI0033F7081E